MPCELAYVPNSPQAVVASWHRLGDVACGSLLCMSWPRCCAHTAWCEALSVLTCQGWLGCNLYDALCDIEASRLCSLLLGSA